MSEIYVVIGPPRSGTTLVAGILHLCGVPMFPSLDKAIYQNAGDEWNRGGHFTDLDAHLLVSRFLPGVSTPDPAWSPDEETVSLIHSLIAERSVAPKWGFKGMHSWIGAKVLHAIGQDVRVIRTQRPLAESQASFTERTGEFYKSVAADFIATAKSLSDSFYDDFPNDRKMTVDFTSIYDSTESTVGSIASFAGVSATPEAVAFVDPNGRRFW